MIYTYDPILVFVSIVVAVVGAYACFDSVIKIRKSSKEVDRSLLLIAASTIGGSIWSMHFVAMQALNLPIVIRYDILVTLVSGLTSILLTGLALLIVTINVYSLRHLVLGGVIMGLGITLMHYIGMSAMRGDCTIEYEGAWIVLSIAIGVVASTASLWAALRLKGLARRMIAALIMGVSISGVHYIGMIGTSFVALEVTLSVSQPILSPFGLGLLTACTTFVILGGTILSLMPRTPGVEAIEPESLAEREKTSVVDDSESVDDGALDLNAREVHEFEVPKIPIQNGKLTQMIDYDQIVSISADGHYTSVHTLEGSAYFCNYSISSTAESLPKDQFLRVHRSHIVNLAHVEAFQRRDGKGVVTMLLGKHCVPVSRLKIKELRRFLNI